MSKQMRNRIRMVLRWVFYVGNEYFTTARRRIQTRRDDKKNLQHLELRYAWGRITYKFIITAKSEL